MSNLLHNSKELDVLLSRSSSNQTNLVANLFVKSLQAKLERENTIQKLEQLKHNPVMMRAMQDNKLKLQKEVYTKFN